MPAKSGVSHGVSAFVTLILGTALSKWIWTLLPPLGRVSLVVVEGIRSITGADVPTSERFAGTLVIMVALSFAWGVVYHLGRHS